MRKCVAGLAWLLVLLTPGVARAHGGLRKAIPAPAAVLDTVPREIRLEFSEAVELAFTRVELTGVNGPIQVGAPRFADQTRRIIVTSIERPLTAGRYTVKWQVAGADGHPVRSIYAFSIKIGAAGVAPAPVGALNETTSVHHDAETFPDAGGFNSGSPLYVAIRWLQFSAILIVTGAVAFYLFVLGFLRKKQSSAAKISSPAAARAASIGMYAAAGLVLVAGIRLLAQSYAMHSPGTGFAPAEMWSMIAQTTWGLGWILQILAAVGALIGFTLARRGSSHGWRIAAVSVVVGAFAPALSGHAASAPNFRTLAIVADGVHIMGGAGWLGSLLVLLLAGIPAAMQLQMEERGPAVAHLVNAFSPTALVFAAITAIAGVFAAWLHMGNVSALWESQYGRTLLVKLAILGIVTATGAYNFLYVKPRLGTPDGVKSLRRSATVEVAVAFVVLIVTAVLVATPTPMDMNAMMETK